VFGSYVRPLILQPNLTVLTDVLVSRLIFDGKRVTGVEVVVDDEVRRFTARCEMDLLRKSGEAFSDQAASLSNCAGLR
jgi:choline dehydrogenase-like flavoprotein